MTVGYILPLMEVAPLGITSSWSSNRTRPASATGLRTQVPQTRGPMASALPTGTIARSGTGSFERTHFHDYYNQVHVVPRLLDFGAVTNNTLAGFYLWNAFLVSKVLSGIAETSLPDVDLVSPPSLPATVLPLATLNFTAAASQDGVPVIGGRYNFDFTSFGVSLEVRGLRAKLFLYPPNWRDAYRITYEYKTDIMTSRSGKEQRRALRTSPRKTIEFTTTLKGAEKRRFEQDMARWQNGLFVLPEIPRQAVCASAMGADDNVVNVETVPDWLVVDALVVIAWRGRYDVRKVQALSGTEVTFTSSGAGFPAGTLIHPALTGLLAADIGSTNPTNGVAEINVSFAAKAGLEAAPTPGAPAVTKAGREVFTIKPNWATAPTVGFRAVLESVDYGRGVTAEFRPVAFRTRVTQEAFTSRNFEQADAIVRMFQRMKGQRGEFYRPSGYNDMDFVRAEGGSQNLRVAGTDIYDSYNGDTVHKAVCISMRDGSKVMRLVESIITISDDEGHDTVLVMTETFATTLNAADVVMVSWMPVCRLASDQLTVEWLTSTVAQTQVTMQTLEQLAAE